MRQEPPGERFYSGHPLLLRETHTMRLSGHGHGPCPQPARPGMRTLCPCVPRARNGAGPQPVLSCGRPIPPVPGPSVGVA